MSTTLVSFLSPSLSRRDLIASQHLTKAHRMCPINPPALPQPLVAAPPSRASDAHRFYWQRASPSAQRPVAARVLVSPIKPGRTMGSARVVCCLQVSPDARRARVPTSSRTAGLYGRGRRRPARLCAPDRLGSRDKLARSPSDELPPPPYAVCYFSPAGRRVHCTRVLSRPVPSRAAGHQVRA